MHQRYVITIQPVEAILPPPLSPEDGRRVARIVGKSRVVIDTPDAPLGPALRVATHELPVRLVITEGDIVPMDTPAWPQSGMYNQLIISGDGEIRLHNDTFGLRACFFAQHGGLLRVSNSLRLLRAAAGLDWDELGIAQMYLFGGYTASDRTILRGAQRIAAGTEYRFRMGQEEPPAAVRLAHTWTTVIDDRLDHIVETICDLWTSAAARHIDPVDTPIGLMLSGGLDSRLVAGAVASRGKRIIGLTFGDVHSDEVRIAGEVAAAVGAQWLARPMDESFAFERLAFDRVNASNETMYNLMWDANLPEMVAAGVTHFSSGATFETTFGGHRDADPRRRLLKNVRQSLVGAWHTPPATAEQLDALIETHTGKARKRARNYAWLLTEPYRSLMSDSLPAIRDEVAARIHAIAASAPIAIEQVNERFDSEQYQGHHSRDQERQLAVYGTPLLPTCDRDVADYLTNLPAGMKYDHALYYRVFRRLYPRLAAIQVPNLSTDLNKSQLQIELIRAWHIQRKSRLSAWVNFDAWMRLGDNLAKYERLFLDQAGFFDPVAVAAYFDDVRAGRQRLYDGGETAGFLNLAYLLDERRATAAPSPQPSLAAA